MNTYDERSVEYLESPPLWTNNNDDSSRNVFTSKNLSSSPYRPGDLLPEWESILDDTHTIYLRKDSHRELSPQEVRKENPHHMIQTHLMIPMVLIVLSVPILVISGAVPVYWLLSLIIPVAFSLYLLTVADHRDHMESLPTTNRVHRHESEIVGEVFSGRIPDEILGKYSFSKDLVEDDREVEGDADEHSVDVNVGEFDTLEFLEYQLSINNVVNVTNPDHVDYRERLVQALNLAVKDPDTRFQVTELVTTLVDYNSRFRWKENDEDLMTLIDTLFAVVDKAWTSQKEWALSRMRKWEDSVQKRQKEQEEIEKSERAEARKEIERTINTVKAFDEIKENNPCGQELR